MARSHEHLLVPIFVHIKIILPRVWIICDSHSYECGFPQLQLAGMLPVKYYIEYLRQRGVHNKLCMHLSIQDYPQRFDACGLAVITPYI